jgi:hypothetical protein
MYTNYSHVQDRTIFNRSPLRFMECIVCGANLRPSRILDIHFLCVSDKTRFQTQVHNRFATRHTAHANRDIPLFA